MVGDSENGAEPLPVRAVSKLDRDPPQGGSINAGDQAGTVLLDAVSRAVRPTLGVHRHAIIAYKLVGEGGV
jgi:hypothetical protein